MVQVEWGELSEMIILHLIWMFLKLVRGKGVISPSSCLDILKIMKKRYFWTDLRENGQGRVKESNVRFYYRPWKLRIKCENTEAAHYFRSRWPQRDCRENWSPLLWLRKSILFELSLSLPLWFTFKTFQERVHALRLFLECSRLVADAFWFLLEL